MMKQKDIAKTIQVDEGFLSRLLSGKRSVSWPLAQRLSEIFPARDVVAWKNAKPEELKRAFRQLPNIINETKGTAA